MHIPSPSELGLPERFTDWRMNQEQAISNVVSNTKRSTVICAPTGFGKEVLCVASAIMSGKPTCIVTASRGLEDQYYNTYKEIGMVDLRGRDNYICTLKDDERFTCSDGYNARCPYKGTIMCPSSQAEMRAATSNLVVTNYDKWTSARRFGQGFEHIQHVIFDEGHNAPEALARAMQVELGHKEIETLGVEFLDGSAADDFKAWKYWAIDTRGVAEEALKAARQKLIGVSDPKTSWIRHYTHMRNLVRRLGIISTAPAKDWVVDQTEHGYQFDPIRPGRYAEAALLLRVPKVTFVSATITPKTMFMAGIGRDNFNFYELDSDFDPRRCPVYWVPTMRVEYGKDLSLLWNRLDQVLSSRAKRLSRNGIIHTVSFNRQEQIFNSSRFAGDMLVNLKGNPPTEMVERFKSRPDTGSILVSPSVGTGYDFPDSTCRFQFICKIPFEPPSKIQKARQEQDKEYVYARAMQTLVQQFGRDVRSNKDWSERFICDDHFGEWFYGRYKHLAPKFFRAVFKQADTLPRPLDL